MNTIKINYHVIVKGMLVFLFSIVSFSCQKQISKYYFPTNEIIEGNTINDFSKYFKLTFHDYEGFKGVSGDSIFKDFVLMTKNHANLFGCDVLSKKEVIKARDIEVEYIYFNGVRRDKYSLNQIKTHLNNQYEQKLKFSNVKDVTEFNIQKRYSIYYMNKYIGQLDLNQSGVLCYFLTLYKVEP